MKNAALLIGLGLLIMVGGTVSGCAVAFFSAFHDKGAVRFLGPGKTAVVIKEPGKYILWNDYVSTFKGMTYDKSPQLPAGWQFILTEDATGESVELTGEGTYERNEPSARSNGVLIARIEKPGKYTLIAAGSGERPFTFEMEPLFLMGLNFRKSAPVILLALVGGGMMACVGMRRFVRSQPPPLQSWPRAGH